MFFYRTIYNVISIDLACSNLQWIELPTLVKGYEGLATVSLKDFGALLTEPLCALLTQSLVLPTQKLLPQKL